MQKLGSDNILSSRLGYSYQCSNLSPLQDTVSFAVSRWHFHWNKISSGVLAVAQSDV